jgi:hypothetical protein
VEGRVEGQLRLPLCGLASAALWDAVVSSRLALVEEELEEERARVCGPRYAHQPERRALRGGHVEGSLVLGGRRVKVQRPRARSIGGQELSLPSWQGWSARVPLDERALDQNSWARASESAAPASAQ